MTGFHHLPVMPDEVIRFLAPHSGGTYLDGTLGGGGHARLILEASAPDGLLIAMDRDPAALKTAVERLAEYEARFRAVHGDFSALKHCLSEFGITALDGFLLDLGVSSHQLDTPGRGFSFQQDGPLDMRMDTTQGETAADLVNELPEIELEQIIRDFGEERWARRIAQQIVRARGEKPITGTLHLADIVKGAIPRAKWEERLHPATRTFQGLRIAVNHELESIEKGLRSALELLCPGGRGVVLSFHSLEDRIVKTVFREFATGCICPPKLPVCACNQQPRVRLLTGRPVTAPAHETGINPRSRSAKLRAVEKLHVSCL